MTIILVLGLCAGLYMLWLLFNLAAYALPLYAGLGVCISLLHQGYGFLPSISAGFLVGIATLVVGQLLFELVRSPTLRTAIAILFVTPAGFAGYQLVHGIAGLAISSGITLTVSSALGGGFIARSAWRKLISPPVVAENAAVTR